ncbi:MAG TPA: nickel-dependent lactate racemase [Blastocatellia bacterium]|jgi:nickel-dependent lactate racemase|nr:nickel-dependent lactate racemase [Blastocatellia bacterium]
MITHLQYGKDGLEVDIPSSDVTTLAPRFISGLPDEAAAFREAVRAPINSPPLRELIGANDRVAVVIPDLTRPLPSDRLLTWLFAELGAVPAEKFVIINGTGSHRVNTPAELASMVGDEIASRYRIVNHNSHDPATLVFVGKTGDGREMFFNREYVEADKRIVTGFIEPHFMAGFSGGYKGVFPALADIDSIMHYHRADVIGHPLSAWGVTCGNPTQEQIRANGRALPVDFLINVTLNRRRQITGFFCGEPLAAHERGCAVSKSTVMIPCPTPFPIVITTNSGYPLDQNLYQAVKGMSAAAQIVERGGLIVAASKCNDGFPSHGNFKKLLFDHDSPQAVLDTILAPGFSMYDQWEAQLLALIRLKARVGLYSDIAPDEVRRAHLEPVADAGEFIAGELKRIGKDAPIAVLPEGPMTIPYLSNEEPV